MGRQIPDSASIIRVIPLDASLVRNAGTRTVGMLETYEIDMDTCLPIQQSEANEWLEMGTGLATLGSRMLGNPIGNGERISPYMALAEARLGSLESAQS